MGGNGDGGYEAVVTEADDITFTVVSVTTWEETHVLRSCCFPVNEGGASRASNSEHAAKRRRIKGVAASPAAAKPALTPVKCKRGTPSKQSARGDAAGGA